MEIKNVQIPFSLFRQLVYYHLMEDQSCSEEICKGLMEKVDRMANRQLYTQSKTASTEEEREKSRQEYLDRRGNTRQFPMVTVLVDYPMTGACHAPVDNKQGTDCKVQTECSCTNDR